MAAAAELELELQISGQNGDALPPTAGWCPRQAWALPADNE
jgi:hypothetical protein